MQHRYVADIGDFGKFQLLRALFNPHEDTLALIWFLHENEENNNDGKHTDYFARVQDSDPALEAIMIEILQSNTRQVQTLEKKAILHNAHFYYPHIPSDYHDRAIWLEDALNFSASHPIVAVAPDNGIALKCQRESKTFSFLSYHDKPQAHKYIYLNEIDAFYHTPNRKITILYQHLGRCFSHEGQINALLILLKERYQHVIAIKHKPYSPRVFFFLCQDADIENSLREKLIDFATEHARFWELYTL